MICRLCLKDAKEVVQIFAEHGANINVAKIVSMHFWFEPKKDDPLSTAVCRMCWENVHNFHLFYLTVKEAHRLLAERFLVQSPRRSNKTEDTPKPMLERESAVVGEQGESEVLYEFELSADGKDDGQEMHSTVDAVVAKMEEETLKDLTEAKLDESLTRADCTTYGDNAFGSEIEMDDTDIELICEPLNNEHEKSTEQVKNEESSLSKRETRRSKRLHFRKSSELTDPTIEKPDLASVYSEIKIELATPAKKRGRPFKNSKDQTPKIEKKDLSIQRIKEIDAKILTVVQLSCYICHEIFETFTSLKTHIRDVHNSRPYATCCNKKFYKRALFVDHIEKHLNPNIYKCDECNKTFAGKQCMRNHILLKHQPDELKTFECPQCDKKFAKPYLLEQHRAHHAERTHPCTECGRFFGSVSLLNSHFKLKHSNNGQVCEFCAKIISGRAAFEQHQLMHQGVPQPKVQCDICGSWHKDKNSLQKHKRRHGETAVNCYICGKSAPNRGALMSHMRYVHVERNLKCSVCSKAFKKPINLKEHMALHTGEVLYKCQYCPKTFNSNANMHSHRKRVHPVEFEEARRARIENASKPMLLQENRECSPDPEPEQTKSNFQILQSESYGTLPNIITIENHKFLVSTEDFNEDIIVTIKDQ